MLIPQCSPHLLHVMSGSVKSRTSVSVTGKPQHLAQSLARLHTLNFLFWTLECLTITGLVGPLWSWGSAGLQHLTLWQISMSIHLSVCHNVSLCLEWESGPRNLHQDLSRCEEGAGRLRRAPSDRSGDQDPGQGSPQLLRGWCVCVEAAASHSDPH